MTQHILLSVLFFLIIAAACNSDGTRNIAADTVATTQVKRDSVVPEKKSTPAADTLAGTGWIKDFKAFRDAVYRKDKQAVKAYFDFPVTGAEELWHYVLMDRDPYGKDSLMTKQPFTEKDFETYFNKLFPPGFIKTLMKVRSQELAHDGVVETENVMIEKVSYRMYATIDRESHSLRLSLGSLAKVDEDDYGEFSAAYVFRVVDNNKLKFDKVLLAG